jgi:multidrug efflux pump subunit AcrB
VHIAMVRLRFDRPGKIQRARVSATHWIRVKYSQLLIKVLRRPVRSLTVVILLFAMAVGAFFAGMVRIQFFAFDPTRLFYVNVEMPPGTQLQDTLRQLEIIEEKVHGHLKPDEARGTAAVAGQMFTQTTIYFGDQYGQLTVSLNPRKPDMRGIADAVDAMREDVLSTVGPKNAYFFIVEGGPPKGKPISVKVRGDDFDEIDDAVSALKNILRDMSGVSDITDDASPGKLELILKFNTEALRTAGLNPADIARTMRLLFDGEIVASMQSEGQKLEVRVRAVPETMGDIDDVLEQVISLPDGRGIALGQIVNIETGIGKGNIRHYKFRRAVTLEADVDKAVMDTGQANQMLKQKWEKVRNNHPRIDLDFSGELDDIQESLDAMLVLALFGIGLIYLILGTQFKSYWQPFMILITVPLAFTGVTLGLVVSQNPFSLFTLYGVVALIGIVVNSAIVMMHAANHRLTQGMSVLHATLYAARRRVVPIIITSLTTVAGLFSLAIGLGGKSLVWGPVASAIVWGLAFSTMLTLFVIPLLYQFFMRRSHRVKFRSASPDASSHAINSATNSHTQ